MMTAQKKFELGDDGDEAAEAQDMDAPTRLLPARNRNFSLDFHLGLLPGFQPEVNLVNA
uniref:Uncharacterized protein n=1 Tax=Kalanchoe fedtschenkoi TaxID=63787 RepID=A0A7N0VKK1_KALFE